MEMTEEQAENLLFNTLNQLYAAGFVLNGAIIFVKPKTPGLVHNVLQQIARPVYGFNIKIVKNPDQGAPVLSPGNPQPKGTGVLTHSIPLTKGTKPKTAPTVVSKRELAVSMGYTGNTCEGCGSSRMTRNGTCEKCGECGQTSGCS